MMTCRLGSRRLGGSRGSLQAGTACTAASELDLSTRSRRAHKARLKLLGASGEAPLLGGWRSTPHTPHAPATPAPHHSHNHLAPPHCNGTDRGGLRRRSTYASGRLRSGPHWSFVFDPAGRLCYYWSMVVSLAFLYNLWVIVYRFAFQEINGETLIVWFCLDYFSDFLYLADILFHFRTGYLEDGVLQTDAAKLRAHYMNSTIFYIDCLCLLPLDFLYLSIGFNSILRSFRLVKIYRFWAFMDRTERHTNYPNLFRSTSLIHYLLVIFHWNGCLYHIIYKNNGFGSKNWVYHDTETADVVKQYLQSYYWCTLALTTIVKRSRLLYYIFSYIVVKITDTFVTFCAIVSYLFNVTWTMQNLLWTPSQASTDLKHISFDSSYNKLSYYHGASNEICFKSVGGWGRFLCMVLCKLYQKSSHIGKDCISSVSKQNIVYKLSILSYGFKSSYTRIAAVKTSIRIRCHGAPHQFCGEVAIVRKICDTINVPVHDVDICSVRRIAKFNPDSSRPRNILLTLPSERQRDIILSAYKRYNKHHQSCTQQHANSQEITASNTSG
ncbi:hypothetical protein ABMA28_011986 [Loxostege sticticalis]|uniref:Ion transport domain-containing protein n=1 Tax=Loxostege sticticalis TaxID=481309 RepID=A0ABD0TLI0_LOXSC